MAHAAISHIEARVNAAKNDSDFTYFYALLLAGEALLKLTVLGCIAAVGRDPNNHRYELERRILKADGLGPWAVVIDDALAGAHSQFLLTDFSIEKNELTRPCAAGSWQYRSVAALKQCLDALGIESEELPTETDMRRWFRMFAILRNKTRGHGATMPGKVAIAATHLRDSIDHFYRSHSLFQREWSYVYRNLSGKYRVTAISDTAEAFDHLKKSPDRVFQNGVYVFVGSPRFVPFLYSDPDLTDFFFANGSFGKGEFECLSYATDNKTQGDGSQYLVPPGGRPNSETHGSAELAQLGNCFSNAPGVPSDYIPRPALEAEIRGIVENDRHPAVTLVGRGGIGKTSLALAVVRELAGGTRFQSIIWFSARDVDLQVSGPKPVKPHVVTPEEVSRFYVELVDPKRKKEDGFSCRTFFEGQLTHNEVGPCLYIFDNFETTQSPEELFAWLDTHVRLPNKILITTRLRDFKGDYWIPIGGMAEDESRQLIHATGSNLGILALLTAEYVADLILHADGHPYVIKILLGEVAKQKQVARLERIIAGRDEILTALFERTYASLSPCAQRTFMTLAAWNSAVPRVALEAVLQTTVTDIAEVERAIDSLLQYSLAERIRSTEGMDFVILPLVALVFGRKKLNVSPYQAAIRSDAELLQMLGAVSKGDLHFSLAKRIDVFLGNIAKKVEKGELYEKYEPIVEMIGRSFPRTFLSLARLYIEDRTPDAIERAKAYLRRYLEHDATSATAAEAWKTLARACYSTGDMLGDVHAFVQRSKIACVPFNDLTGTARLLNDLGRKDMLKVDAEEKRSLAKELLQVMTSRAHEANAEDMAQMAWLAMTVRDYKLASECVANGLALDGDNPHLLRLLAQPNIVEC